MKTSLCLLPNARIPPRTPSGTAGTLSSVGESATSTGGFPCASTCPSGFGFHTYLANKAITPSSTMVPIGCIKKKMHMSETRVRNGYHPGLSGARLSMWKKALIENAVTR